MKKFIFQITLTEEDLAGEEFWEEAIKDNRTVIGHLTDELRAMIDEYQILHGENTGVDVLKLISYTDD